MAKLHLEGGVTFEGTPEEIKAYTDLYAEGGAEKAQEKPEALELNTGDWVKFTSYKGIVNREDISLNKAYQVFTDTDDELAFVDDAGDRRSQPLRDKEAYEIVAPPSVFERIGRKEGEFKVGDIVRVIGDDVLGGENKDGDIGVVTSFSRWTGSPQVRVSGRDCGNDGNGWFAPAQYIELIAPVESRVDAN